IAALPENGSASAAFVVERHATEVIPGAGYWLEASAQGESQPGSSVFLGIGDPIYNAADPRAPKRRSGRPTDAPVVLPRLVGSGAEIDRCSLAWRGDHVLLKGADASRDNLMRQLLRRPAVVHLATHVLESTERPSYGLIALSLTDRNETELLQPME